MNYFEWQWVIPAAAAVMVLVGYLAVWLFRWAKWVSWRRNFDKPNTEKVRTHWDKKTKLLEVVLMTRRAWPFGKWTKGRGFHAQLGQILHQVPVSKIRIYINERLREDRKKSGKPV